MEYGFSFFTINKFPTPFVNELRIGNWICSYMVYMDDKEISHKGIKNVCVDGKLLKYLIDTPFATYKGIPISYDILEKCGFVSDGIAYTLSIADFKGEFKILSFRGDYLYLREEKDRHGNRAEDDLVTLWNKDIRKEAFCLHNLQNLYFSLTGQELTVNL